MSVKCDTYFFFIDANQVSMYRCVCTYLNNLMGLGSTWHFFLIGQYFWHVHLFKHSFFCVKFASTLSLYVRHRRRRMVVTSSRVRQSSWSRSPSGSWPQRQVTCSSHWQWCRLENSHLSPSLVTIPDSSPANRYNFWFSKFEFRFVFNYTEFVF